jgi:uncharacterized protein involved in response to NO
MRRLWRMVLHEPYRVFFPLGALAGIFGVMMWPMMYAGWLRLYPGEPGGAHAHLMIEGFMGAFLVGFLGTAFPRLTGNRPWFGGELLALLVLWSLTVTSHASGHVPAGNAAFSAMLLVLLTGLAGRWIFGHRDTPPPGFILVFAGVLGAAVAAGFLARNANPAMEYRQFARLWLFQGFLLFPVMGIGPYVLPRFFGANSEHSFADSPTPPVGWWRRAVSAIIAGGLVVVSFALEAHGNPMAGHLLRALVIVAWFALEIPILRRLKLPGTPGNVARWALVSLGAGCACAAIWPFARVGSLHLFFVSGLGLVTLAVATRVILGHAGRHDLLAGRIVWMRWMAALVILAATTRMSAEFLPDVRVSHLTYAAWTWTIAAIIWLLALAKHLFRTEESVKPKSNCPRSHR